MECLLVIILEIMDAMTQLNAQNVTVGEAKHQQTVVVYLSAVGTAVILPIGIWTLYLTYKAKLRPM